MYMILFVLHYSNIISILRVVVCTALYSDELESGFIAMPIALPKQLAVANAPRC